MMLSLLVGLAVNAVSVDSIGNSRGSDRETVTVWLRSGRFYKVVRIGGKRKNSFRSIFSFIAGSPKELFSALMSSLGEAGVANCTCSERAGSLRVLVCRPSISIFFLARSCVVSWLREASVTVA